MGATLIPFSPLSDSALPEDADGVILGGGYPELYLEKLSMNISMLNSIKAAVIKGLPTYAECGGFMYLGKTIELENVKYKTVGTNSIYAGYPHLHLCGNIDFAKRFLKRCWDYKNKLKSSTL